MIAATAFAARRAGHGLRQFFGTLVLTSATLALTLGWFGGFLLVQLNLEKLLTGWSEQIQFTAYLAQDLGASEVTALLAQLKNYPEIERLHHTSQEQAWSEFHSALGSRSTLLEGLPKNILPASIDIMVRPEYRDSTLMESLAGRLKQHKELTAIEYPQQWAERLGLVVAALRWLQWLIGGGLFLVGFFIVRSMIKLALLRRQDEIEVLQLLGAGAAQIQAPLVIEGSVHGLIGASSALAMLWASYRLLRDDGAGLAGIFPALGGIEFLDGLTVAWLLAIGVVLGAAASVFALRGVVRAWKLHGTAA